MCALLAAIGNGTANEHLLEDVEDDQEPGVLVEPIEGARVVGTVEELDGEENRDDE